MSLLSCLWGRKSRILQGWVSVQWKEGGGLVLAGAAWALVARRDREIQNKEGGGGVVTKLRRKQRINR